MVLFRRNPKLFYVSSSTTTLSTTTVCYVSTTAVVVACKRRKRRAVLVDALDTLVPSAVTKAAKDEERYDLAKGQKCPEQPGLVSKRAVFKD